VVRPDVGVVFEKVQGELDSNGAIGDQASIEAARSSLIWDSLQALL
jgi:hypothetical protein